MVEYITKIGETLVDLVKLASPKIATAVLILQDRIVALQNIIEPYAIEPPLMRALRKLFESIRVISRAKIDIQGKGWYSLAPIGGTETAVLRMSQFLLHFDPYFFTKNRYASVSCGPVWEACMSAVDSKAVLMATIDTKNREMSLLEKRGIPWLEEEGMSLLELVKRQLARLPNAPPKYIIDLKYRKASFVDERGIFLLELAKRQLAPLLNARPENPILRRLQVLRHQALIHGLDPASKEIVKVAKFISRHGTADSKGVQEETIRQHFNLSIRRLHSIITLLLTGAVISEVGTGKTGEFYQLGMSYKLIDPSWLEIPKHLQEKGEVALCSGCGRWIPPQQGEFRTALTGRGGYQYFKCNTCAQKRDKFALKAMQLK